MEAVVNFVKSNVNNYLEELKEYLRIPSISTLDSHKNEMLRCAKFAQQLLKKAGMTKTEIFPTEGHPVVYGEWMGAPGKPTILLYEIGRAHV